jgi:hypothetical protein
MKLNPVRQKGYKVVIKEIDGDLVSVYHRNNAAMVTYLPDGTLCRPTLEHSKLFVFSNLWEAKDFATEYNNTEVWEVETYGASNMSRRLPIHSLKMDKLVAFWTGGCGFSTFETMKDSFVCKSLRLIKKL